MPVSRRHRVYLTLSVPDADLLQDGLELLMGMTDENLGHKNAALRFERMHRRLTVLTDEQRPSLAEEGMFDGPPDDYDPDQGGT